MDRLLNFVYQYRAFFTFLLLELICAWLVVENNQYQSTRYFNTTNRFAANIIGFSQGVREYMSLKKTNADLAQENAMLRSSLERYAAKDSLFADTTRQFDFISAKVINNSTPMFKNYITINKGKSHGLEPGMAVISTKGTVGKVKSVSENYAVLISVLNVDHQLSSMIKRTEHFGIAQWDGTDQRLINLNFIPRHVTPMVGDTVVTSGFNSVFPTGVIVGVIRQATLTDAAQFWDIKVELAQDFGRLQFVEIVRSFNKQEKDSLELNTLGPVK